MCNLDLPSLRTNEHDVKFEECPMDRCPVSPSVPKEIELVISPQTTVDNVPISTDTLSLSGDLIVLIKNV